MEKLEMPSSMASMTPFENSEHLEFAAERARILLGCYRKGEANDPALYGKAVAGLLSQYSQNVIYEVTNPLMGLPSRTDFMPTLKELKHACELEAQRENRINNSRPLRVLPKQESKPDLSKPSYEQLLRAHGRPVGAFEKPNDEWNKLGGERQFNYGA